jgi:hypothetical protein
MALTGHVAEEEPNGRRRGRKRGDKKEAKQNERAAS